MFNREAGYAIRAATILAQAKEGDVLLGREIARKAKLPSAYLSKILEQLALKGLLFSQRGRGGGFRLSRPPQQITIAEIVNGVGGFEELEQCVLGMSDCQDKNACVLHNLWKKTRSDYLKKLMQLRLSDISKECSISSKF